MLRYAIIICLLLLMPGADPLYAQSASEPESRMKVKVTIEGLDAELRNNVRAFLTIEQQKNAEDLTAQRVRRYHARADDEIARALQPYGYYQPDIKTQLQQRNGAWVATYQVDRGPPVIITELDIRISGPGGEDAAIQEQIPELALATGERFVHKDYERAKYLLQAAALDAGYRDAYWEKHEVQVLQPDNEAQVTLHLDTGDKYYFGPVSFQGSTLRETLLQGYLPFHEGDPWSSRKLLDLQRTLLDTNYFSRVDMLPRQDEAREQHIPVEVQLTPRRKQRYSIGAGYATDTGPRVTLNWQHRQINRRGHRFEAGLEASGIGGSVNTRYSIPLSRPRTDVLDLIASMRTEETDTAESDIQELRVSRSIQRGKWQSTQYLSYEREDFKLDSGDEGISNLLIPGASWLWVDANDRLVTRKGNRLQFEVKGSAKSPVSDTTFAQSRVQAKTIQPLGERGRWIARADLGGTVLTDVGGLPASQRFFAGGDQSIRGYDYQGLGPRDDNNEVTGGIYLAVGSIEYNYRIRGKWHAAVFFDSGNAFNDLPVDNQNGAGVGLRWESPVGMLRLDVAAALSEPDHPLRLHFSFGPDL